MARLPRQLHGRIGEHALPLACAGLALWLIGALVIRLQPALFESRWLALAALVAAIPMAEVTLLTIGALLDIERRKRLPAAAFLGAVIIACHALALVAWPSLYGEPSLSSLRGAGWLAWAAVCPTLSAWFWAERV